jgi:photosystem II stability/assembly factor-like uncharacterized protein
MKNKFKRSDKGIIIRFAVLLLIIITIQFISNNPLEQFTESSFSPPQPSSQKNTFIPAIKHEGEKVPESWLNKIHKTAPGDDWRAIEAEGIKQLIAEKEKDNIMNIQGDWVERGPSNIPGRIVDIEIDYNNNHIYAHSDHGIIFRSDNLQGTNWTALNDQHPLGLDVASQLELFKNGSLVTSGWIKVDNYWGVYHSGDGGKNWSKANGFSDNQITGIRRMARQEDTVYVFMQEYDFNQITDYYVIYKSVDKGNNFSPLYQSPIPIGDGGRHRKSDMWVSNDSQDPNLYLMLEDSLFIVNKTTGSRTFNSMISNLPIEQGLLTGLTQNGTTELTAYIATNDIGKFYAWNSIDQTWAFKGEMTDWWLALPFGSNSFSCSQQSAEILYFGGILISKSIDRGVTWTTMDLDPTGSFALYHGDVPKTFTTLNPNTNEEDVYLGTDGGIYKMDENEHFNSISIPGLNCTQIYKMVSKQSNTGEMFIGTQDNGYAHTSLGSTQSEIVDFIFQWGGDVTNVASGDNGETFWLWWLGNGCNYMSGADQAVSTWSPYDFDGSIPYWEPPIWIPNQFPNKCFTAGFLNNNSGNYLIELQANVGSPATPKQFGYNFEAEIGGKISAIAISPLDYNYFYVTTENGYFAYSTDGGNTWNSSLLSNSIYPRVIHPSQVNLGEVWVGGSGYSNSPVYYSTNNGQSFSDLNTDLPPCRVEAFATNADESIIFAATSIGPFAYEKHEDTWSNISGADAPLVQYMDVEFLNTDNTVRFATYARGIWDFQLMSTTSVNSLSGKDFNIKAYPNPANELIRIEAEDNLRNRNFQIVNSSGKVLKTGNLKSKITEIHIADFSSGIYFINIENYGNQPTKFVKL